MVYLLCFLCVVLVESLFVVLLGLLAGLLTCVCCFAFSWWYLLYLYAGLGFNSNVSAFDWCCDIISTFGRLGGCLFVVGFFA